MAPEQIEGLEADARADIFAFGALLFEMLTGRTAFEGKTRAALLGAILKDDPPRASPDRCYAAGHRSRHQHLSGEGSGRSLSVGARSPPRSRLGGLAPVCGARLLFVPLTPGQRRVGAGIVAAGCRRDGRIRRRHRSWRSSICARRHPFFSRSSSRFRFPNSMCLPGYQEAVPGGRRNSRYRPMAST